MDRDNDYENLLAEKQRLENSLGILYKGAREILKLSSFEKTAETLFGFCKKITGATSGYVALLSDDGEENKVLYLDSGKADCRVDPYLPMPVRGLREKAYSLKKTVYHNDFSKSEWQSLLPEGHVKLKNVLFAPLIVSGKVVGLIGMANKPGNFNDYDANIAGALGNLAASALQNSLLFEEVRKQNAGKERLISIMSHDIKNHINSIQGFSDLLIEKVDKKETEKIRKFAGIISSSSSDANQLLDDLLTWVKTDSGKLSFKPDVIDLEDFIDELAMQYRKIAEMKNIDLYVEVDTPSMVVADKKMVATVMRNLLSNAIKFTNSNGTIEVSAKHRKGEIEISVSDDGVGMSPEQIDNLFNAGKGDGTDNPANESGAGLGLVLCFELLEKHSKKLKVDSQPGKGSRFSFSLPFAEE